MYYDKNPQTGQFDNLPSVSRNFQIKEFLFVDFSTSMNLTVSNSKYIIYKFINLPKTN